MYSQDVADRICAELAEGKSLRAVCRADDMPAVSTVLDWVDDPRYQAFGEQYARARARQYAMLAEEIIDISDDKTGDVVIDADGNERTDAERVARSKLRVDSRKWMLSKMLPKVYGEKLETTLRGSIAIARDLTDNDLANIAAGVQKL